MATPVNPAYPTSGRYPGNNSVSRQEVYDYLMTKPGMTDVKANAIMANIEGESGFYSDAIQTGNVDNRGLGLFQHTFPSRKEGLVEEVPDWETNWKGQIDYAMGEPEMRRFMRKDYDSQEEATEAFMMKFENPAITSEKYPGKTLIKRGNNYYYLEGGKKIKIPKKDYEDAVRQKAEGRLEIYDNTEYRQNVIARNNITQEDYENYYEGAESVTVEGDNVIVDFGGGNVVTEPKATVNNNILAQRNIEEEGGIVGAQDRATTGQQNPPVIPPVTGPGIEGDTQVVTNTNEDDGEPSGLSNEQATANDTEGAEYEVTLEEAQRVYGPTANIVNINGVDKIVYTDNNGDSQTVETNTVTADAPDYTPPVNIPEAERFEIEDQPSVQDRTQRVPPVITPEVAPPRVEPVSAGPIDTDTDTELDARTATTEATEGENQTEETDTNVEETDADVNTEETGTDTEEVVNTEEETETDTDTETEETNTETQVVEQPSLTQTQVEEIYGPNARITTVNGQDQIQYTDENGEPQSIFMSDAVARRDDQIALEEELQQERNANILGLRRRDFRNLEEEELNQRLDETTLSDEQKEEVRANWTSANEDNVLEKLFNSFTKGDGSALKKAGDLLKASGGVSSLVAGFIGTKAAKKGMETVDVPQIEGLSSAFKQYSMQQKALAETGLSYAERQTLQQGIDEAYEQGIQNLVRGTGGDRAKFLAGTGALDLNRQTSLLKVAALEDEARRQNRDAYGKILSFEANYNKDKDIFTKSREYNQKLADKAMFQNTASAAFDHVFDNIRFGQDYKPMLDAMEKLGNQIGTSSSLLGVLNTTGNDNDPPTDTDIEAEDPNEQG